MNIGTYGLPSSFLAVPSRPLAMTQVAFGQDNSASGGSSGAEVLSAVNPNGLTADNNFLSGYTLRVTTPFGSGVHARIGLRGDGVWGIGGGSYQPYRLSLDLNSGLLTVAGSIQSGSTFRLGPNDIIAATGRVGSSAFPISMSMSQDNGATVGSFICYSTGTWNSNLAGMSFWNQSYAIKMGVRSDGFFGIGGWSRAAWSWYTDPSGNMVAGGDVTAYSDPRLKEGFAQISDPFGIIGSLVGGTFTWRRDIPHIECKAGRRDYGILADQVEAVMPEVVSESVDIDGQRYKMVAYDKMIPVLIEAVKLLKTQVVELQDAISKLQRRSA